IGAMSARLAEGLRYVHGDRVMKLLLAIVAIISLLGYPYVTLMPMAARNLYVHDDARGLGILVRSIGIRRLLRALALPVLSPRDRGTPRPTDDDDDPRRRVSRSRNRRDRNRRCVEASLRIRAGTAPIADAGGVSEGSRWSERSERPPDRDTRCVFDSGRSRGGNSRRLVFGPRRPPGSSSTRRLFSGGRSLRSD